MNIVIAGAGSVGRHLAEVLAASGSNVTIIELHPDTLRALENELDIRTLRANCAHASALVDAGVPKCDMFVAATDIDEINLLAASVAKRLGAKHCTARVHHRAYFSTSALDYGQHLGIDDLICPEHATAVEIARSLRNPGAIAIEDFARGQIVMQELSVDADAKAVGQPLANLSMPHGVRIAVVTRDQKSFIPKADTIIDRGDVVSLIGERDIFDTARRMFQPAKITRKHVVVMGESSMGVWLCRALRHRHFAVRLFVTNPERAEELAEKLEHITVVRADPTEPAVFTDEGISDADAFVALTDDDEHNILGAAQAKSMGVKFAVAVTQRSTYLHLLQHVGIDRAYSPRQVAVRNIQLLLDRRPVRVIASMVEASADIYEVRVGKRGKAVNTPLRELKLPGPSVMGAILRGDDVCVPGADDKCGENDVAIIIGKKGLEKELTKLFAGK